jgi:hypothetical protein
MPTCINNMDESACVKAIAMPTDYDNDKERETRTKSIRERIHKLEAEATRLEKDIANERAQTRLAGAPVNPVKSVKPDLAD